jgi:hypothetical protein
VRTTFGGFHRVIKLTLLCNPPKMGRTHRLLAGEKFKQPYLLRQWFLGLSATVVLLVTFLGNPAALAGPDQRRTYQESPLSPVATPFTSTVTSTGTLTGVPATIVTDSLPVTTSAPVVVSTVEQAIPTVALVNQGQTSLLLVGAVLVGILLVIGLVIWRQR